MCANLSRARRKQNKPQTRERREEEEEEEGKRERKRGGRAERLEKVGGEAPKQMPQKVPQKMPASLRGMRWLGRLGAGAVTTAAEVTRGEGRAWHLGTL